MTILNRIKCIEQLDTVVKAHGEKKKNSDRGLVKSESRQDCQHSSCLQVIQGVVTRCPQGHPQEAAEGYVCVFSNQAILAYVVL